MRTEDQPAPRILQIDADAFYVQVARLMDPEGAGKATMLLVGGSPEGRGVVTSASYEARKLGARSAMPMGQALRLCPGATVVGVPRGECGTKSRAISRVLGRFSPIVEPASIDEMYVDLSGTEKLYEPETLEDTARRIRRVIKDETEIDVSVGGGTTRLIAKLAANLAKPHKSPDAAGVIIVPPGGEAKFMQRFDLAAIPGIGPKFQERLESYGLVTVNDALKHEPATLQRWLGERAGTWLYRKIRGQGSATVEKRVRAKSISRDETFSLDHDDDTILVPELLRLADRATRDLRAHRYAARTISVKIRDFDFKTRQKSRTLREPVTSDAVVGRVARELFDVLRKARPVPARLLGVSLSKITPDDVVDQMALFEQETREALESQRDRDLSRALDQVRAKFGGDAVARGRGRSRRI